MENYEEKPYGYIYVATNRENGKKYVGQTVSNRWKENQDPIEERWREEVGESYRKERRGENLRYIENAIIKYGPENFDLKQQDVAYSQEDLDKKETDWIKEYDSMNPDKGYNLKEGGRGGVLSESVKENLSAIGSEKWQNKEYVEKQLKAREELTENEEFIEKMTDINRERAKTPEYQEKMSKSLKEKWQEPEYQKDVSKNVSDKWQQEAYRERQIKSRSEGKREIPDRQEFLNDIREMKKKDINTKYDMDGKCINRRIEEMLGRQGIKNYSQARDYLKDKNLEDVLKDVNEKLNNSPDKSGVRKEILDKQEFLKDIQEMKKKDINTKYDMNATTVNKRIHEMLGEHGVKNYTEAKKFLENKNINEVVKEINERQDNQSQRIEGKTVISDKQEFLEDIQNMQKNEMNYKYGMDAKTINSRIEEMLRDYGIKNYSEARDYLQDKNVDDVLKDIEAKTESKEVPEKPDEKLPEEIPEESKEDVKEEVKEELVEETNKETAEEEPEKSVEESTEESTEETPEKLSKEKRENLTIKGEAPKNEKVPDNYDRYYDSPPKNEKVPDNYDRYYDSPPKNEKVPDNYNRYYDYFNSFNSIVHNFYFRFNPISLY